MEVSMRMKVRIKLLAQAGSCMGETRCGNDL
jgi:hypothetical protein